MWGSAPPALDLNNQLHLLEYVRNHTREHRVITLMVLHDLNQAGRYADKVMLTDQGRVSAMGMPAETLTEAKLRAVYGVECEIIDMSNAQRAIYPLHRIEPGAALR